jgi:hypothetical protein
MPSKCMRRALAFAGLCLVSLSPAWAGLTLDASWQHQQELETELPASGYGAGLSFDLDAHTFISLGYSAMRTESFEDALDGARGRLEYRSGSADLGLVWPWTDWLGLTATGGYSKSSTRGLDGFENDRHARVEGPTGSLTLWYQLNSILSFNVGRGYSYIASVPGWDTSGGAGVRLWGETWLDAGYWRAEGMEGWTAGLRTTLGSN